MAPLKHLDQAAVATQGTNDMKFKATATSEFSTKKQNGN